MEEGTVHPMVTQTLRRMPVFAGFVLLLAVSISSAQAKKAAPPGPPAPVEPDVSGMYTFLQEGEFVQINVESPGRQFVKIGPVGDTSGLRTERVRDGAQTNVNTTYTPPLPEKLPVGATPRAVTGFVSRFGDLESDKGTFLDHFFTKASLYGNEISFTTKTVHGVRFEFKGRLERGPAKSRAEEGYYVLRGTLKRFQTDANKKTTSQSREAVFKSFPDIDAVEDPTD